ncbi:hypothetical protein HOY80DRAFT_9233 [Tuber brumale]|nr:hypothetical protein HOY80DRAFT_9233 [Tuber brumale]
MALGVGGEGVLGRVPILEYSSTSHLRARPYWLSLVFIVSASSRPPAQSVSVICEIIWYSIVIHPAYKGRWGRAGNSHSKTLECEVCTTTQSYFFNLSKEMPSNVSRSLRGTIGYLRQCWGREQKGFSHQPDSASHPSLESASPLSVSPPVSLSSSIPDSRTPPNGPRQIFPPSALRRSYSPAPGSLRALASTLPAPKDDHLPRPPPPTPTGTQLPPPPPRA